jgi:transposase, IS5 family
MKKAEPFSTSYSARPMVGLRHRCRAIEPEIGHMKTDDRLSRCPRKGITSDAIFAVLCACGHNIRKIPTHLRAFLALIIALVLGHFGPPNERQRPSAAA